MRGSPALPCAGAGECWAQDWAFHISAVVALRSPHRSRRTNWHCPEATLGLLHNSKHTAGVYTARILKDTKPAGRGRRGAGCLV